MGKLTLVDAVSIAVRLHGQQVDKLGEPYLGHLVRVMLRLPENASHDEKLAAILHDVIEDIPHAFRKLTEANVPAKVIDMIDFLTRHKGEDYSKYVERVARSPCWRIKLADIQDNMDESRLSRLPPEEAQRLRKKYASALRIIYDARPNAKQEGGR